MSSVKPDKIATVGTFDGLHLGHLKVLGDVRRRADEAGLTPIVFTFNVHPLKMIAPERSPKLLTTLEEKLGCLQVGGCLAEVLNFDNDLRMMSAHDFLLMLRDHFGVAELVLGFNNHIGHDRDMSDDDFDNLAQKLGIKIWRSAESDQHKVSSTILRRLVSEGRIDDAAQLMGRPYPLTGIVGHGKELGRTIGFPTANLTEIDPDKLLPAPGVYAGWTMVDGHRHHAMVNIGFRPTVDKDMKLIVEVHVINYNGDLYGRRLTVNLTRRIRSEQQFDSIHDLRVQLELDRLNSIFG